MSKRIFLFLALLSLTALANATANITVILTGNSTIFSENNTFELGFFTPDPTTSKFYLGIWYSSIPTRTYIWVANRETPLTNISSFSLLLTSSGKLAIASENGSSIWETTNDEIGKEARLLESGNLVLKSASGVLLWQSFDYPTDTWLPGMNITGNRNLTCWRSSNDPSPGFYSLRLNPREFNEFELVYDRKGYVYWSTGNWTGNAFSGVPEMTIPYIYKFYFVHPFRPTASFWYEERELEGGIRPPLTRFQVDVNGKVKQFTWSQQIENWYMFWSQPENQCKVYGLCGDFGVCKKGTLLQPCDCLSGFRPNGDWESGDYSGGCVRKSDGCAESEAFINIGAVGFEGADVVSFPGSRDVCERSCLGNCSCVGLAHDDKSNLCKNFYGDVLNLRNLSSDSTFREVFSVRVPKDVVVKKSDLSVVVLICGVVGFVVILGLGGTMLVILRWRRKDMGKDNAFAMLNLKVFSYKELYAATSGFSNKIGHGGFGAVFQGQLIDSTPVAVKQLERLGSGEKEFRAEVCTVGNIQHVNLVRLRGFCSEESHRLLVYDYMPNGPLSMYLRQDGPNLSWDARFRVAIGTARGIAYLHEECRECIIHCDIKPENILLDSEFTAKISDFGLAKLIGRDFSRVLATMRGTWGYVAPEWISGVAITTKADVYSFGMTLLELLGGRRNIEAPSGGPSNCGMGTERGDKWFFPPFAAQKIIDGNVSTVMDYRLGNAYNPEEAERVALVAIWCIQDNEEMRPTMGMVVKMLEGVVGVTTPPPPKLLQALISGDSYHGVQMDSGDKLHSGVNSDEDCGKSNNGSHSYS